MFEKKQKIERNLKAVSFAFEKFSDNFEKGKTAGELFTFFTEALAEKLGEYEILYDYIWGRDSVNIDGVTEDSYVPQDGDTVIMDISIGKDGVWCDVCRTYFVGEPTSEQKKIYELIRETINAGEKTLKSGALAEDMYKSLNKVYEAEGLELVHHAGHKIGESNLMQPQFLMDNKTKIESNEFYTIESGHYGDFGIRLENDYFVSDNETENMFEHLMSLDIEKYILN